MTKHIILFLAANPLGTDRLALDEEARAIRVALERSRYRDQFQLETRGAARPLDLLDELRKLKPTIVHFSGHGGTGQSSSGAAGRRDIAGEGTIASDVVDGAPPLGLFFQGPDGDARLVSTAAIQQTFGVAAGAVKLVVLNACYTDAQAEALLAHVSCVVGMDGSISDAAARNFAAGFYGGLGESQSVAAAYSQGRAAISLEGLCDSDRPWLKVRDGVDAGHVVLTDNSIRDLAPLRGGWTWCSSVESEKAGKISVLAIVETIMASTLYAWIAWRFGTFHLMISACIAPFLLLRTSRSTLLASRWFGSFWKLDSLHWNHGKYGGPFERYEEGRRLFEYSGFFRTLCLGAVNYCYFVCFSLAGIMIIRVSATIASVAMHPLETISEIPHNWWRSVVCIDSHFPLETLPDTYLRYGFVTYDDSVEAALFPGKAIRIYYDLLSRVDIRTRLALYIGFPLLAMTILLPATLYRWSLKGSAVIYSPLIWIVHSATGRSLRVHLQDILKLEYYRIARWFAAFVLLLFLAKVYMCCAWDELAPSWQAIPGHRLLNVVVMPDAFPPWQIASAANAVLVCILYFVADWAVMRMKRGSPIHEEAVEVLLRWLLLVRGVLSVYTILCGIYLAASLSGRFALPPMGTRMLPWQ